MIFEYNHRGERLTVACLAFEAVAVMYASLPTASRDARLPAELDNAILLVEKRRDRRVNVGWNETGLVNWD
jgi:hypothetical protein